MRRFATTMILILACVSHALSQTRTVQNRPYTDLRPFHFGVVVGTHLQDLELLNAGPQIITNEDGTTVETLVTADQDRWDTGFNVGVVGEYRISTYFQFRVAPTLYFGNRHITFRDMTDLDPEGKPREHNQNLKSVYISSALDLIFAAPRFNNHRPYLIAGVNPMINLSGKSTDYIRLKRYDICAEVGFGCDFYLPFFKLRPELKFMYGLGNSLDTTHADRLRDRNMLRFAKSVKEAHTKMIVLSFYFE